VETLFHPTGSAPTLAAADGAEDGGGDGGRAGEEAAAAAGGRRRQSRAAAGVEFCRWDVLACINCDRGKRGQPETTAIEPAASCSTSTPVRDDSAPRKLGPSLLELRRLEFSAAGSSGEDDDEEEEGLFSTSTTLCVSRGSPTAAGTSVASTCLDVWRRQEAGGPDPSPCATGLTTGALCIHTFRPNQGIDGGGDDDDASFPYVPTVEHYHTSRSQRSATAVAWRPSHRQVAIGLTEQQQQQQQSAGPSGVGDRQLLHQKQAFGGGGRRGGGPVVAPAAVGTAAGGLGAVGRGATGGGGGDRECCCLVWDVEHQSGGGGRRSKVAPLHKLSHQTGVTSLAWLEGGQTLAVGGQHRNLQLFDLRLTGATPPPIQVYAHNFGVHGIAADPVRTWQFATFCRAIGEVVKLWDARRMDTPMTEIKVSTNESSTTQSNTKSSHPTVTAVQWSTLEPGQLSIVMGNAVYDYDASGSGARPVHTSTLHNRKPILDFALYPYSILSDKDVAPDSADTGVDKRKIIADLFPKRMVVVLDDRTVRDVAKHRMAPLAISNRDGRVLHALGRTLWAGSPSTGPTAIDSPTIRADEDISATMVRRARCFHAYKYAMNTRSNINVLAEEESVSGSPSQTRDQLLRLWTWIERVEDLCAEIFDEAWEDVSPKWSAKGLMNAGIWSLLRLDDGVESEMQSYSESLCCTTYESEGRR
jgi:WD40 repeat protein